MQVHVINRVNKLPKHRQSLGKLTMYDNATEITSGARQEVDREAFKALRQTAPASQRETVLFMLKEPTMCPADEVFHYVEVQWADRLNGQRYRLFCDTVVFVCNDAGKTQVKVQG